MEIIEWYNKLTSLNGKVELEFAKKCVEKYNIKKNIPFFKRITKTKEKEVLIDFFAINIELNKDNILTVVKEYDDFTDYGFSAMSCEDWSTFQTVVEIKLKNLLKNE